jgi:tetratricopeptide (TPR) repeat protein
VITSSLAALKETVQGGVLIEGDPHSKEYKEKYVKAVLDVVKNEDKWKELNEKALKHVEENHIWSKIALDWKNEFEKIKKKTISLCMIVKDEEKFLSKCLESVKDYVDEIIVVDTGSKDKTKDIALGFGAKVFDFTWVDDFSKARNFSLTKATKDWILILDADEIIHRKGMERIGELINKDAGGYLLTQKNYTNDRNVTGFVLDKSEFFEGYYPSKIVRLFKNSPGLEFKGRVHERVDDSVGKILDSGVDIEHFQFLKGKDFVDEKQLKYFELLKKKEKEVVKDPKVYFDMGVIYNNYKGMTDLAIENFEKCLSLNPDYVDAYINLGEIYAKKGDLDKAEKALEEAIVRDPKRTSAFINLGAVYDLKKEFRKAAEVLIKALNIDPGKVNAYLNLGVVFAKMGKIKKAIEAFEEGLRRDPKNVSIMNNLAVIYFQMKKIEEAEKMLKKALEIDPDNVKARMNLEKLRGMK